MPVAHHKVRDEPVSHPNGYAHIVGCSCGEEFWSGPSASPADAQVAALDIYKLHLLPG